MANYNDISDIPPEYRELYESLKAGKGAQQDGGDDELPDGDFDDIDFDEDDDFDDEGFPIDGEVTGQKKSLGEQLQENLADGTGAFFKFIGIAVMSIIKRTKEDWAKYFNNLTKVSIVLTIAAAGLHSIIGLKWFILPLKEVIVASMILCLGSFGISKVGLSNIAFSSDDSDLDDFEDGEEFVEEDDEEYDENDEFFEEDDEHGEEEVVDLDAVLDNVPEMLISSSRQTLWKIFAPIFYTFCEDFDSIKQVPKLSNVWIKFHYNLSKAFTDIFGRSVSVDITSLEETKFCYVVYVKKIPGITLDRILKSISSFESYFKDSENDMDVSAQAGELGSNFVFRFFKPQSELPIITIGDILQKREVKEFFLSKKRIFPFIAGVKRDGEPYLLDLNNYPHILVTGATGGGKTWFLLQLIFCMAALNSPQEVSFLIMDYKADPSYRAFTYLPHTLDLESDPSNFVGLMECIEAEALRRKNFFNKNNITDIGEYWQQYPENKDMPFLVVIIDELNSLHEVMPKEQHDLFISKIKVFTAVYRSLGLKLIVMPQRARSDVLDKNAKGQMDLRFGLRLSPSELKLAFDVEDRDVRGIFLSKPGDAAVKAGSDITQVRTPALTENNAKNKKLIDALIFTWGKLNPELPPFKHLKAFDNRERNFGYVRKKIGMGDFTSFSAPPKDIKFEEYREDELLPSRKSSMGSQRPSVNLERVVNSYNTMVTQSRTKSKSADEEWPDIDDVDFSQLNLTKQTGLSSEMEDDNEDEFFGAGVSTDENMDFIEDDENYEEDCGMDFGQDDLEDGLGDGIEADEGYDNDEKDDEDVDTDVIDLNAEFDDEELGLDFNLEDLKGIDTDFEVEITEEDIVVIDDGEEDWEEGLEDSYEGITSLDDEVEEENEEFGTDEDDSYPDPGSVLDKGNSSIRVRKLPKEMLYKDNNGPSVLSIRDFIRIKFNGEISRLELLKYYSEEEVEAEFFEGRISYKKSRDSYIV